VLVAARKHTWRMKKGLFFIMFKNPTDLDLQYRLIILKTSLLFIIFIGNFDRFFCATVLTTFTIMNFWFKLSNSMYILSYPKNELVGCGSKM
jgi:hypothetical protein